MKKILFALIAVMMAVSANAQIVRCYNNGFLSAQVNTDSVAFLKNYLPTEGMTSDYYSIGSYNTGWWEVFSKSYVVPDGKKWTTDFLLDLQPVKNLDIRYNFALIITNDEDRGSANYKEYGGIRYDYNPNWNSEWGDYINKEYISSTLPFTSGTDSRFQRLAGIVLLTVDRTDPNSFTVTMDNGDVKKTYSQPTALTNLNTDPSNTNIRCFIVPERSYLTFRETNIVPKSITSLSVTKAPTHQNYYYCTTEATKNMTNRYLKFDPTGLEVTGTFSDGTTEVLNNSELSFSTIPAAAGTQSVLIYSNLYNISTTTDVTVAESELVNVYPTPTTLGATDNTTAWWGAHFDNDIKIEAGKTAVASFTNYCGTNSWNNWVVVLRKTDKTEYGVLRADNYGWGDGVNNAWWSGPQADWATWLAAMNGAKVKIYVTNIGNGTADLQAVMEGTDGNTYIQYYLGVNTIDIDDLNLDFTVDACHLVFDQAQ